MKLKYGILFFVFFLFSLSLHAQWMTKTASSDDLYKMAKREIDLKRYQKAINYCKQALNESPKNLDIHLLLGKAYSLAGKTDSARDELNYVREKNPRYKDTYTYLVNLEATACNYQQAIEDADEGLKYFPNDKDLLLKKMDMYNKKGEWAESDKVAAYVFEHYNSDPLVRSIYIEYKLSIARHYYQAGYLEIALRCYQAVLEQEPLNKEALDAIYNLDIKSGNYAQSLIAVNRALLTSPNSFELYMKKINILIAMYNYTAAIEELEKLLKLYPDKSDIYRRLIETRIEAGRYYMQQDPLMQFSIVLEKQPNNQEALAYAINLCLTRGLYQEALDLINAALKGSPGNRDLLQRKLAILQETDKYSQAADLAELFFKENPTPAAREQLIDLKNTVAKQYMSDLEYDSAVVVLNSVLSYDRTNLTAINYLISVYTEQKRYDDALHVIDEALKTYPDNEQLLYRKAGVLESYQHYADAAKISKRLIEKRPRNRYYINSFVEQTLAASRQSMQMEDYISTIHILRQALEMSPDNIDALNYMINLEIAQKQFDSALYFANQGMKYYPESKDFVFKKSVIYAEAHQYREAYSVSGDLYRNYPYNSRFRALYMDQLVASGKQYQSNGETDSAILEFNKALEIAPNDTVALFASINMLFDLGRYEEAIPLVETGRRYYPGNPYFLLKRATVLEGKKSYLEAWRAMDTLSKMGPLEQKWIDYKDLLYSKTLRDEVGILFLLSTFDPDTTLGQYRNRRIATLQYSHKYDKGSLVFKIDYVGTNTGSGYLLEAEGTLNHSSKLYSWVNVGYSDITDFIFPHVRLGYSMFLALNKGYDLELGARYAAMGNIDSYKVQSGAIGLSKEWRDFYFTGHVYLSNLIYLNKQDPSGPFTSYNLLTKYFVNDERTSYFSVIGGYGLAPDDLSRVNQANYRSVSYSTVNVGAGYQIPIHHRTTLYVAYTWYNIEYHVANFPGDTNKYKNQYDLNVNLLHKF